EEAWDFLGPHIEAAAAVVFTRAAYVPPRIPHAKVAVIPPSIDPFSPKNQDLSAESRARILGRIGVFAPASSQPAAFVRRDGTVATGERCASIVSDGAPLDPDAPLVVQVSRWDRLKDMPGVMRGFAVAMGDGVHADLALVGPAVEGVTDDPEGAEVL